MMMQQHKFSKKECKEINDLLSQLFENKIERTEDQINSVSTGNAFILTTTINKKIIAMACVYIQRTISRYMAVIEECVVDKKHRGKGVGHDLMDRIIALCKWFEVDCIELTAKNAQAIRMYKGLGFEQRGTNKCFRLWLK